MTALKQRSDEARIRFRNFNLPNEGNERRRNVQTSEEILAEALQQFEERLRHADTGNGQKVLDTQA